MLTDLIETLLIPGDCLAIATILGEAGQEPYEGKLAVARVIRERMRLHYGSDGTLPGTVLAPLQFSLWNTHDPGRIKVCKALLAREDVQECKRAWLDSMEVPEEAQGVVLYHADYISLPSWARRAERVMKIGRHIFYRERPR